MRLTSEFFVSALVRRVFGLGGFAAVERKGAAAAGAVFIRQRFRDNLQTLYGPAPQTSFESGKPKDRLFEIRMSGVEGAEIDDLIVREIRFDPDLWLVEIEADLIGDLIEIIEL